jgi:hypothetical protein
MLDIATGIYPLSMTRRTIRNSSDKPTQLGHVDGDDEKNFNAECVHACKRRTIPLDDDGWYIVGGITICIEFSFCIGDGI